MPKLISIKVYTIEAVLEFSVEPKSTGKELFDQVVKTIGLREIWFFGLQYEDNKGLPAWLKMQKKITSQDMKSESPLIFHFSIKFYPEDVKEEVIQEVTMRMFFLEVRNAILNEKFFCPSERATLLESYACQVIFGDYEEGREKEIMEKKLLPQTIMDTHSLTKKEWVDRISECWKDHEEFMKDDAMMGYLVIAQDLEMYGVNYFDIKNRKGTELLMGVDALGINVYEKEDKLVPKIGFPWSEIRNVAFSDKKFTIKPIDKKAPDFNFFTPNLRTSRHILSLTMGNHERYVLRRKPDSMEIQQMKKERKENKEQSIAELVKKKEDKKKQQELEEKQKGMQETIEKYEQEMKKKDEEFEKLRMQNQEEIEKKNCEIEKMKDELGNKNYSMDMTTDITGDRSEEQRQTQTEMNQDLQKKLTSLKADLDLHKDAAKVTHLDVLHNENTLQGREKFRTLTKIRLGNTRSRIEEFEGL